MIGEVKAKLKQPEQHKEMHSRTTEVLETNVKKFEDMNNDFGDAIAARLATIEGEENFAEGRVNSVIQGARGSSCMSRKKRGRNSRSSTGGCN